jgi:RNA polymerase sigma-70 factor (ECF subfamily)
LDCNNGCESASFPTTRWTLIRTLQEQPGGDLSARTALEELCSIYWSPLYGYARRFCAEDSDAQDEVQDLFVKLLERGGFSRADPSRGRLRSFLLKSLKNSILHGRERLRREKRGGGIRFVPIETLIATDLPGALVDEGDADRAFDRAWARALLQSAVQKLQARHAERGQTALFNELFPALGLGGEGEWQGAATAASRLDMSEEAVRVALHRLRKTFGQFVRAEVAATVGDDGDVQDELRYLASLLP